MSNSQHILLAGEFYPASTTDGIDQGMRMLGLAVHRVDLARISPSPSSTLEKIACRLLQPIQVKRYNRRIIETAKQSQPDFLLTIKGAHIQAVTLARLAEMGIPSTNYYPDFHFSYPGIAESTFSCYTNFVTTKSFQIGYLQKILEPKRVHFLHHGYVDHLHFPFTQTKNCQYLYDVQYIGNHTVEKERWLTDIKKKLPNVTLRIIGNRWTSVSKDSNLLTSITGYPLYGRRYAQAVQEAKINLAVHMGTTDASNWQDLVSTRTFEIPACKGFMLHIDNMEVQQLFLPGREIDVFQCEDSLCDKISWYLKHDEIRHAMADRAYRRCVPDYGYNRRAKSLLQLMAPG